MSYYEMAQDLVDRGIFWFEDAEEKELYDETIEVGDRLVKCLGRFVL